MFEGFLLHVKRDSRCKFEVPAKTFSNVQNTKRRGYQEPELVPSRSVAIDLLALIKKKKTNFLTETLYSCYTIKELYFHLHMLLDKSYYSDNEEIETDLERNNHQRKNSEADITTKEPSLPGISPSLEDKYSIAPNVHNYLESLMVSGNFLQPLKYANQAFNAYFYLDIKLSLRQRNIISNVINQYNRKLTEAGNPFKCNSLVYSDLKSPLPLHVTLVAQSTMHDQSILDKLRTGLVEKCLKTMAPIELSFKPKLIVLQNSYSSRYFIALEVEKKCAHEALDPLARLIHTDLKELVEEANRENENGEVKKSRLRDIDALNIKHMSIATIESRDNLDLSLLPQLEMSASDLDQLRFTCTEFKMTKARSQLSIPLGKQQPEAFKLSIF